MIAKKVKILEDEQEFMADEGMDLLEESSIPLYKGSKTSRVVAVILIFNCFAIFGVSNACATELLKLLLELLPVKNTLPESYYEARKYRRQLGSSFVSIHVCVNGCCLFPNELEDAMNCPKCGQLRYKLESNRTPMKILQHFPLIPRLLRMYRCTCLLKLNKWHTERKDWVGNVECVPDSKAWKHIDSIYPRFALEEKEHTTRICSRRCESVLKPIPKSFQLTSCTTELQFATMVGDKAVFPY